MMRVFVCTDHAGHYPVGTASVVLAPTREDAERMLAVALAEKSLPALGFTLRELPATEPRAVVLCDGEY